LSYIDVEFVVNDKIQRVPVILKESKNDWNRLVSNQFSKAFSLKGTPEYKNELSKAWNLKQKFANVDYGYAITSHKSQGSTYNIVVVDEKDINSVSPITNKEKSESIYTALTRASTTAVVISSEKVEDLSENIEEITQNTQNSKPISPEETNWKEEDNNDTCTPF